MIEIWRIDSTNAFGNSHQIGGRIENWEFVKDCEFEDDEEEKACEYVIKKNFEKSDIHMFIADVRNQCEKADLIDRYCFSDDFYAYRKYFLGEINREKLAEALNNRGIKVQIEKAKNN